MGFSAKIKAKLQDEIHDVKRQETIFLFMENEEQLREFITNMSNWK